MKSFLDIVSNAALVGCEPTTDRGRVQPLPRSRELHLMRLMDDAPVENLVEHRVRCFQRLA